MANSSAVDRILSRVLTVCAVIAVGFLVEARFRPRQPPPMPGPEPRVEQIANWRVRSDGIAIPVDDSAAVDVLVFTDFQCPFCARLDSALGILMMSRPGAIRRSVVHYPLPGNVHAFPAAVAFECAARQGRERVMHRRLYEEQRNRRLALGAWTTLAVAAGVEDRGAFESCVGDTLSHRRILDGIRWGSELAIRGTPALIVGGWLIEPPTQASVESALDAVLAGKVLQPQRNER